MSNRPANMRRLCAARRLRGAAGGFCSRVLFALLLPLVLFALAPAAAAQTSVYHIRGNATAGSNNIWAINPATGAETLVYTGYPGGNAATLAQRPSDGMLFYVINDASGQNGAVYRFNPATPSIAPVLLGNIGPSTSGGNVLSGFRMAFNNAGTLYYMSGGGGADNDTLYTLNQATGRATSVATITGTGNGGDMAFNGATLYIMNQNRQLYSATVAGGAATSLGTVTFPGGATPGTIGLGVDGSRILITTTTTAANMYAITLPSLSATLVGALSGGTTATGDLSTTVITAPSISVTKTDGVANTYQGASLTYTVVVTNSGTYTVTASVNDTIPAGLTGATWTCVASAGSSCAAASGSGNIATSATLLASGTATYSITATVTASSGTIANTATANPPAWIADASPANNTATDTDNVVAAADLSITKTTASTFIVGSNAVYTLTATNSGPQSAAGTITVSDTLPAGLTYVSATGTGWACSAAGQVVTCTRAGPVTSGTTLPAITLTVAVGAAAAPSVTNTATVASNTTFDPDATDNSSSVTSPVTVPADLTIAKSHSGNFTRGATGTYTLTVSNAGGAATSGTVTVTDTLPVGLSPSTQSGTGWTCGAVGQTITCTRLDALAAGASYPVITVVVNVLQSAGSSLTNTASASGGGQTNTANDSSSDPTTVVSSSDLSLSKTVNNPNPIQGQNVTFTLTLTNAGPSNATNVVVTDALPAGLTFVSATPSTGTYTSGTGAWAVASLTSGANATLQIVALVSNTGTITNTTEVTASDQPDPDSTPNNGNPAEDDRASASIGAAAPPSIALTKSVTPSGTQVPGTDITYTVAFVNTGGSPATTFVLTDPNPATVLKLNDYTDFKVGSIVNSLGTTGLTVAVAYSNNNGASFIYTPVSGAGGAPAGYDRTVTHIRWTFTGSLSRTSPNNSGGVSFSVRIR